MPDLTWLADLGRASVTALWVPVAIWSAVALVAEAALRLGRTRAALALPVRGAVLAALPLAVLGPAVLAGLAPKAVVAVSAAVPDVMWLPEVAVGGPAPVVEAAGPSTLDVLLGLAVLGVVIVAAYRLVEWLHALVAVARARRSFATPGPDEQAAVETARQRLGVERPVRAAVAPTGAAPFTVGWRRPVVALPTGLDADAREVAAVHEVAHVRRGDFAWHAAQRVVTAVFGAHPLVWVLGRGLDLDREHAADAVVLDACPDKRRAYADLLFSYATLPAPALALGAARGSSSLKSRIDAMTRPLSPTQSRRLGHLGRLAGLVAVLLTAGIALAASPSSERVRSALSTPAATLEGVVTDADSGMPVVGASLQVVGTTLGAATGPDGRYRLDVPAGDQVIRVTAAGYEPRTVSISDGQQELDVALTTRNVSDPNAPLVDASRDGMPEAPDVFEIAEEQPQLIGGLEGIQERLEYPELQRRAGVQGRSVLQFIVEKDGSVSNVRVIRSAGNDGLDRAAIAAVQEARFRPGRQRGEPVRVRFAVPITFRLSDSDATDDDTMRQRLRPLQGEDGIYNVAEDQPTLIGGLQDLQDRVVYPQAARDEGVEGQVVVQFIVNEEGRVQDAVVLRSPDDRLSDAALAAVRGSTFEPGMVDGEPVKTRFAVPVTFRLPGGEDRGEVLRGPLPGPDEVDRRLPYAGTDLTLLENQRFVDRMMAHTLGILDQHEAEPGVTLVGYTMNPNGHVSNVRTAESSGSAPLDDLARGLVASFRFREDRSPPTPREGTFRLHYAAAQQ